MASKGAIPAIQLQNSALSRFSQNKDISEDFSNLMPGKTGKIGVAPTSTKALNTLLDTKNSRPSRIGKMGRLSPAVAHEDRLTNKGYKEIALAAGGSYDRAKEANIALKLVRGKYLTTEDKRQAEEREKEQRAIEKQEMRRRVREQMKSQTQPEFLEQ